MPEITSSQLQTNTPIEAAAPDAALTITMDASQPMAVGSHMFQLEVVDSAGNRSQPARVRVVVLDDQAPTAIITGPERVGLGAQITLSGERSADIGGRIERYIWTLVE